MKHWLVAVWLTLLAGAGTATAADTNHLADLATPAPAGESQRLTSTNVLIRLTEIDCSYTEIGDRVIASFVPISITHPFPQFGGGSGKGNWSDTVETKIGKEFTIISFEFHPGRENPHQQTLHHVLKSCVGTQPRALKLDLVLSVPAEVPHRYDGDFSHWVIQSIEVHKCDDEKSPGKGSLGSGP